MVFYSPTTFSFLTFSSLTSFIPVLYSLFLLHGSWSVVLVAELFLSSSLHVVDLCSSSLLARRRSLYSQSLNLSTLRLQRRQHVANLSTLSHSISLLFGRNIARSPVVAEIWSNFGFCGVVFESLVVDVVVFLGFVVNLWVSVSH